MFKIRIKTKEMMASEIHDRDLSKLYCLIIVERLAKLICIPSIFIVYFVSKNATGWF